MSRVVQEVSRIISERDDVVFLFCSLPPRFESRPANWRGPASLLSMPRKYGKHGKAASARCWRFVPVTGR